MSIMETALLRCAFTTSIVLQESTNIFLDATLASPLFCLESLAADEGLFVLLRILCHTNVSSSLLNLHFLSLSLFLFFYRFTMLLLSLKNSSRVRDWMINVSVIIFQVLRLPF